MTRDLRWNLFFRAIAIVFGVAFASLAVQIPGLIGGSGISPAMQLVHRADQVLGSDRWLVFPTLFWLEASDFSLRLAAWSGAALSALVACGILPRLGLLLLWALYLSFATVCAEFLSFQWDNLLLEAGLFAAAMAPGGIFLRDRNGSLAPPAIAERILEFLMFRLVFFSGFVKLASGDPTWRDLTALQFHFETQPLPTWTSWWAHHVPDSLLRTGCALALAGELGLPVLLFFGRRARIAGATGIVVLQSAIAATGNFGFFNLLTLALCIPLFGARETGRAPDCHSRTRHTLATGYAALAIWFGGWSSLERTTRGAWIPAAVSTTLAWAGPFRSFSDYGLFAVMTTWRPEIVIETSDDGTAWREIPFRWKPGKLSRAPRFTGPHMPRLDWQMWFAALEAQERGRPPAWVHRFLEQILNGSPEVAHLLAPGALGASPPRYGRARLDVYRFTTQQERRESGDWWSRRTLGALTPVLSLDPPQ